MTPTDLRTIRVSLGLSQRDLEECLRLKPNRGRSIRMWESGERTPSGPVLFLYELLRDGVIECNNGAAPHLTRENVMSRYPRHFVNGVEVSADQVPEYIRVRRETWDEMLSFIRDDLSDMADALPGHETHPLEKQRLALVAKAEGE